MQQNELYRIQILKVNSVFGEPDTGTVKSTAIVLRGYSTIVSRGLSRTSHHYRIEGLKGGPQLVPRYPKRRQSLEHGTFFCQPNTRLLAKWAERAEQVSCLCYFRSRGVSSSVTH